MPVIYFKIIWQNNNSNLTNSKIFMPLIFKVSSRWEMLGCQLYICIWIPWLWEREAHTASSDVQKSHSNRTSLLWREGPENLQPGKLPAEPCRAELHPRPQECGARTGPSGRQARHLQDSGRTQPAPSFISANGISRSMTRHKHEP